MSHLIEHWQPEDKTFWQQTGKKIATRNLWISIPALLLAFAIWQVWSVAVVNLPNIGFKYSENQLFWLAALPALSGATLRIFYSFMVPIFGGRKWTAISTASLLLPAIGLGFGLQHGWHNPSNRNLTESVLLWLERMQLQHISGHYPHQISGGQRQRTALARACITRPKWLLLDEPFSALDADLRQQMRQLVGELQSELSVPMLIISHDSADTQALADEVLHMENGRLKD